MSKACTGCSNLSATAGNDKQIKYNCQLGGLVRLEGGRPSHDSCPLKPVTFIDTHLQNPTLNK